MCLGDSHEMYDSLVRVSCDVGYEYRAMLVSIFVSVGAAMSIYYKSTPLISMCKVCGLEINIPRTFYLRKYENFDANLNMC